MKETISVAALINLFPDLNVRKQIRCAALKLGSEVVAQPAQNLADSLEEELCRFDAPKFSKSGSVYKSNLRKLFRWAVDEGLVKTAPSQKEMGYPTFQQFLGSYVKRSTVPRTVWNHFQHFVASRRLECFKIEARHLEDFQQWLSTHVANYKRQWNLFSHLWNQLIEAGLVPNVRTDSYPTVKPSPYAISLKDLPDVFQQEFQTARDHVLYPKLQNRKGKRPLATSTVDLRDDTILRYLGWLRDHGYELVLLASVADWIQDDLIDAYLTAKNTEGDGLADMGQYQRSILLNMEQQMRHGFLRPDKATLLQVKRLYYDKRFHVRRETSKVVVSLDNVYGIISQLLDRANCPAQPQTPLSRALAVRDAVSILLLAMFGFRRAIVTKLHIGTTIKRVVENDIHRYLVLVPKRLTKPGLRDGFYEVPEQFTYLLDYYCNIVRPYLIGKEADCGYFLREQGGGALSGASLYGIMVGRSVEVLGIRVNPHMLRKSLATEWFEHNPNDLLTLSLIMDCSVRTLEKNYALSKTKSAVDKFDANIRKQLAMGRRGLSRPSARPEHCELQQVQPSSTGGVV